MADELPDHRFHAGWDDATPADRAIQVLLTMLTMAFIVLIAWTIASDPPPAWLTRTRLTVLGMLVVVGVGRIVWRASHRSRRR